MADRQKFNFGVPKLDEIQKNDIKRSSSTHNDVINVPARAEKLINMDHNADQKDRTFEIKYIQRSKIRANKKNRYPQEKLDNMKESILQYGLQQNLTVIYLEDEDIYVLEAGHTRTRALDELISDFENYEEDDERLALYRKNVEEYKLKGYPCKVSAILSDGIRYDFDNDTDLDEIPDEVIDSEIRLIITNEISRNRTPATIAENVERLQKLYQRKNQGKKHSDKINIHKAIGEDLGITTRQATKYMSLSNLIPELREEFEKNNITLTDSSNYAKLTEEEQRSILLMLQAGQKISSAEIAAILKEKNALAKELAEKEERIRLLEESEDGQKEKGTDDQSDVIEAQESEIELLKQEIAKLKERGSSNRISFSKEQSLLAKNDLATRAAYDAAKKSLLDYLSKKDELLGLITPRNQEEAKQMSTLSGEDIHSQIRHLIELLQNALSESNDNE